MTCSPLARHLRPPVTALALLALLAVAACSESASEAARNSLDAASTTITSSTAPAAGSTSSTSTSPTSTSTSSSTSTSTTVAPVIETREVGHSVLGRPITAVRRGTVGGRVVLVIGVIHGNEAAGTAIIDDLEQLPVPDGVDLWLVESMNPDGQAAVERHNANAVDLNRNFPHNWGPIGVPGDSQYAGPGPASEPETQAMVEFIDEIEPDLVLWYHQDLYRISPGTGRDGEIRARYAQLTGLPLVAITGGTYTGVAATWARNHLAGGVAFIVELGETLSDAEAEMHAEAVLTIAGE